MAGSTDETIALRETQHGNFAEVAQVAQELKAAIRKGLGHKPIRFSQMEALDSICTKLARVVCGDADYPDHWHDLAGYPRLVELELERLKP